MKLGRIVLFASLVGYTWLEPISGAEPATFKEKVLWSFGSGADGGGPGSSLIYVNGTLYGTTVLGGGTGCGGYGCGTLFSFTKSTGIEKVLYSFCNQNDCADGASPYVGVIDRKGVLYGTTDSGGANDAGTVFSFDLTTGSEAVVYSFCSQTNCLDGEQLLANLIYVKGLLLGETSAGGSSGYGTVFSLNPKNGAETVLHSFGSGTDGWFPEAGLIDVDGILYGTTGGGGSIDNCQSFACGTVFSIDPSTGTENVLYSFMGDPDGSSPEASLVALNGILYGTTSAGGAHNYGTVFSVDPTTGAEKVLYSFCSQTKCADGQYPEAGLVGVDGTLYGTTPVGGLNGLGTVYAIDPNTGAQTVIHSFCSQQNCADGSYPGGSLINVKGNLYGTASQGGSHGYGTLFVLKNKP